MFEDVRCNTCGRYASIPEDKKICLDCWEQDQYEIEPTCDCRQCDSPCTEGCGGCASVDLQSVKYTSTGERVNK